MENEETLLLERKKLALEIAELERPWWKRPNYILAALPTLLAVVALSVGFLNGFFGAQLTKLENQRHDLELQIKEFETTRVKLLAENEKLAKENKMVTEERNEANGQLQHIRQTIEEILKASPDGGEKLMEVSRRRRR